MHRREIICRVLTGVLLWCGMIGLALYILWTMRHPDAGSRLLADTNYWGLRAYGRDTEDIGLVTDTIRRDLYQHQTEWVSWYYSPLNLHYRAMAMLFFSPALACRLLARGVAGH